MHDMSYWVPLRVEAERTLLLDLLRSMEVMVTPRAAPCACARSNAGALSRTASCLCRTPLARVSARRYSLPGTARCV